MGWKHPRRRGERYGWHRAHVISIGVRLFYLFPYFAQLNFILSLCLWHNIITYVIYHYKIIYFSRYDPYANPPSYGKPDDMVADNTRQVLDNPGEWERKAKELFKPSNEAEESMIDDIVSEFPQDNNQIPSRWYRTVSSEQEQLVKKYKYIERDILNLNVIWCVFECSVLNWIKKKTL